MMFLAIAIYFADATEEAESRRSGRKRKSPRFEKQLLVDYFLANGPPPKRATSIYWEKVANDLFERPSPMLVQSIARTWYCNRHGGIKDEYRYRAAVLEVNAAS